MLQQQQPDRDEREHVHHRMNLFATANNEIKANVRNEAPEDSLGDREGQGGEGYSEKRRYALLGFTKIDVVHALEHRRAHEYQNRRRCINWNHAGEWRQKEARQKAKRRKHSSHTSAPAAM